jgi:hypothetical protein
MFEHVSSCYKLNIVDVFHQHLIIIPGGKKSDRASSYENLNCLKSNIKNYENFLSKYVCYEMYVMNIKIHEERMSYAILILVSEISYSQNSNFI